MTTDAPLGVAVVGTGWGCLTHVPALQRAGFDVRYLVGTDADRTAERAQLVGVPNSSTDLAAVLADPAVSAVVVATPPQTHADIVVQAVAAGKHVVCEKPFATNLADAERMLAAAREAGVVHAVGQEFRWQPHMSAMAETVRGGQIGTPTLLTHVRLAGTVAGPDASAPDWFQRKDDFGGWPNAEIQHVVDEIRMSVGEIETLTALEGQATSHAWDAPETFLVQFTTTDGLMGTVQSTNGSFGPFVNVQRVSGTGGSVWITVDGKVMRHDGTQEIEVPFREDLVGDPTDLPERPIGLAGDTTLSKALAGAVRFIRPTQLLHEAFKDAIEGRERTAWPPLPTFVDGVRNTAAHEAFTEAVRTGQPQRVTPVAD